MSAVVKLGSKMPGDFETNGIDGLADDLIGDPTTIRMAVLWFDVSKVTVDTDAGTQVPTIRVRRIEPLGEADEVSQAIADAVGEAMEKRTGRTPLPIGIVTVSEESRHADYLEGTDPE
ncbi:MAG: hypothetical protein CMF72_24615 [Mameliella sp.]|nr:hypothetical protein [Mameliella sp.]